METLNGNGTFDYSKIKPIKISLEAKTYPARYRMHKYWAKKPYNIVRHYINHYTKVGDVVFDPFCGSGVTAVEALILRRKVIALDLNPISTFITKMTAISPINLTELKKVFTKIEGKVKDEINSFYLLDEKCSNCNSELIAILSWIDEIGIQKVKTGCPKCHSRKTSTERELKKTEIERFNEFKDEPIPFWYPKNKLILNSRLTVKDELKISDLFSNRNLITTSILFNEIESVGSEVYKDLLKFTFTSFVAQATKMIPGAPGSGGTSWKQHGYWMPDLRRELNVWHYFTNRFKKLMSGKKQTNELIGDFYKEGTTIEFYTQSATDLSNIEDKSIDYVFTDPPYGDSEPYLEESLLWNSWLKFKPNYDDEIILTDSPIRPDKRNKTEVGNKNYSKMLELSFSEINKKLSPNRYLTVTFHNTDRNVWASLIRACNKTGLERKKVIPLKASAPSVSQHDRAGALKSDQIIDYFKSGADNAESSGPSVDIEDSIIQSANRVILKLDGATDQEVYDAVIQSLIENNLIHRDDAPKDFDEVKAFLNSKYIKEKEKWQIDPAKLNVWEKIGRKNQLRILIRSFLKEKKEASLDEIYNMVLPQINGHGLPKPSKNDEITPVLKELATATKNKTWKIKHRKILMKQTILPTDKQILPFIRFKELETENAHNEMIFALANLAKILDYKVWIGKKEQSQKYKNIKLFDLCHFEDLPILDITPELEKIIKQIDIIWFDEIKGPVAAFEIENTTNIQRGVMRFQNLIKIEPEVSSRLFIVAPNKRKSKVISELTNPAFLGPPLFIDKKVRYILYEDLIQLYKKLQKDLPTLDVFRLKEMELLSKSVT